jgi:hypothetical protein
MIPRFKPQSKIGHHELIAGREGKFPPIIDVKEEAPDEIFAMIAKRDIIGYYHSQTGVKGSNR